MCLVLDTAILRVKAVWGSLFALSLLCSTDDRVSKAENPAKYSLGNNVQSSIGSNLQTHHPGLSDKIADSILTKEGQTAQCQATLPRSFTKGASRLSMTGR